MINFQMMIQMMCMCRNMVGGGGGGVFFVFGVIDNILVDGFVVMGDVNVIGNVNV